MSHPPIERDDDGRVSSAATETEIQGPLGIWPFPILNLIVSSRSRSKVEVTEINRDEKGRIQSIEEVRL